MRTLAIETSCDETAAAVVEAGPRLVSNVVHTQALSHARFGGVVPEVAAREHAACLMDVVAEALAPVPGGLDGIEGLAVTRGPGLVGALLVGMQFVQGLALARGLPWVGINHLEGHLSAALLAPEPPPWPHVALIVSGGHTHLYHVPRFGTYRLLGGTRDDAAGEAFDKVAKLLGLGYPGGPALEAAAAGGDPDAVRLPLALPARTCLDYSFSGLKTAAAVHLARLGGPPTGAALRDFAASVQAAICRALVRKAVLAAQHTGVRALVLAGGVAANAALRAQLSAACARVGVRAYVPPPALCTDNAAMVAAAGWMRLNAGERGAWGESVRARWPLGRGAAGVGQKGPRGRRQGAA